MLLRQIRRKRKELERLVSQNKGGSLTSGKIYRKSCELDGLIVRYMRVNRQMELDFPDFQPWSPLR